MRLFIECVQHRLDAQVRTVCQSAPVGMQTLQWQSGDETHLQILRAQNSPHRGPERKIADISGDVAALSVLILITDGDRVQRRARVKRGLQ